MIRCAAACGRELEPEDMVQVGEVLVCEPCSEAIAKQAARRDSIDDALAALRGVTGDGALMVSLTIPPGGPIAISLRYHRVNELGPAASIDAHGGVATIAQVMRELGTVIANLPARLPDEAT